MAIQQSHQSLLALAKQVQREATAITTLCAAHDSSPPSLSQDWPDDLTEEMQASREKLREAAKALYDVAVGPFDHLFMTAWSVRLASPKGSYHDNVLS